MEKWIAILTTFSISFVYLTGYSYLDGFYDYFNLSLQEMEFGPQTILAHASQPLKAVISDINFSALLLLFTISFLSIVSIFGIDIVFRQFRRIGRSKTLWVIPLGALFVVSLMSLVISYETGVESAKSEYINLNRMVIKGTPKEFDIADFLSRNPRTSLYHLTTSPSTHFAVIKFNGEKRRWIVRIPRSETTSIRVFQDLVD